MGGTTYDRLGRGDWAPVKKGYCNRGLLLGIKVDDEYPPWLKAERIHGVRHRPPPLGQAAIEWELSSVMVDAYEMYCNILASSMNSYKKLGGPVNDLNAMCSVKTKWLCFKQPTGYGICGYYVCEMFLAIPKVVQCMDIKTLSYLCVDICDYIMFKI
uniref:Uncharacterized protein n=1 Tax=Oryza brachyantha TaxID=4533 RepID=J3MDL3_ORYBR